MKIQYQQPTKKIFEEISIKEIIKNFECKKFFNIKSKYFLKFIEIIFKNMLRRKNEGGFTNVHHITPRCFYKINNLETNENDRNLVNLLYKDHIKVHIYMLLCCKNNELYWLLYSSTKFMLNRKTLKAILVKNKLLLTEEELNEMLEIVQKQESVREQYSIDNWEQKYNWFNEQFDCQNSYAELSIITGKTKRFLMSQYLYVCKKLNKPNLYLKKFGKNIIGKNISKTNRIIKFNSEEEAEKFRLECEEKISLKKGWKVIKAESFIQVQCSPYSYRNEYERLCKLKNIIPMKSTQLGMKQTPEAIKNWHKANDARFKDPEYLKRMSEIQKGKKQTKATIEKRVQKLWKVKFENEKEKNKFYDLCKNMLTENHNWEEIKNRTKFKNLNTKCIQRAYIRIAKEKQEQVLDRQKSRFGKTDKEKYEYFKRKIIDEGKNVNKIANEAGCSGQSVYDALDKLYVNHPDWKRLTKTNK